ncbi:MAG: hypothetical protein J7L42_01955 [Elusimicrobia bacterium]|nr:hypothetical protein [Elusimicrobiota bacterium]
MDCEFFISEEGQGESEYIMLIFCLLGVVFGLRILNFVLNKAYLDAINRLRKW